MNTKQLINELKKYPDNTIIYCEPKIETEQASFISVCVDSEQPYYGDDMKWQDPDMLNDMEYLNIKSVLIG